KTDLISLHGPDLRRPGCLEGSGMKCPRCQASGGSKQTEPLCLGVNGFVPCVENRRWTALPGCTRRCPSDARADSSQWRHRHATEAPYGPRCNMILRLIGGTIAAVAIAAMANAAEVRFETRGGVLYVTNAEPDPAPFSAARPG